MGKKPFKEDPKPGVPAYMVSFGDMMTLILTFFILLVSMAYEQNQGLVAKGLGSFSVAIQSHGMTNVMSDQEKLETFDHIRRRFNLPPEDDPETKTEDYDTASNKELVKARLAEGLTPHNEFFQPLVASFAPGSAELDDASRHYLDRLAATLRPVLGQQLALEGHALDTGTVHGDQRLAFERARAVERYLVEEHGYRAEWIETRAWLEETHTSGLAVRGVDARLITPVRPRK